jgi:hypothetical protein
MEGFNPAVGNPSSNTSSVSSGASNYGYASAGISAISSIAGAIASVNAFEAQMEAQTASKIKNMEYALTAYERNSYKLKEDMDLLDQEFAGKISERGLKAMKDFATMRAASAETGTTGGSTDEVMMQSYVDEHFDVAMINKQREASMAMGLRKQEDAKVNAINAFKTYAESGVNVNSNTLLAGLAGGTEVLGGLLMSMPESVKADFFNEKTTADVV